MKADKLGYIYLINTVILFSTYEVVSKTLIGKVNPFQINLIRFFIGGVILFIFVLVKRDIKVGKKDLLLVSIAGIINVVVSMNLIQLSLYAANSKASIVAVIFSSNPIFVTVFAALIDREKINLHKVMGLLLGVLGIVIISIEKIGTGYMNFKSPLLALVSAISFAAYTIIGRKVSVRIGSLKMNSYSFIIGSVILLPLAVLFKVPVIKFDYSALYQVIYLGVFVTGLAYLTYFKGLSIVGASGGSLIFFVKPVMASIIAIIFLRERLSPALFIGTAFIIAGIGIIIYWNKIYEKIRVIIAGFSK